MNKKVYESPSVIVTEFEFEDVITESGGIVLPPDEFSLGWEKDNEYWR